MVCELTWVLRESYDQGKADYLIGIRDRQAECEGTVTFDRRLRGSPLFRVI